MKRRRTSHIILAAGGTGGHMFPACALMHELLGRGHAVTLVTDQRGYEYRDHFKDIKIHRVNSATFTNRGLWGKVMALPRVLVSILEARRILKELRRPAGMVIGFGGYPAFPTLKAALSLGIPTCLHEQNAVLGKVNRHLAKSVDAIAISFEKTKRMRGGEIWSSGGDREPGA